MLLYKYNKGIDISPSKFDLIPSTSLHHEGLDIEFPRGPCRPCNCL